MRLILVIFLVVFGFNFNAFAKKATDADMKGMLLKAVPESKVVQQDGNEYEVATAKQTIVEVEFKRDGTIEEASGDAAHNGDAFVPGNGMIALSDAVEALKKAGKTPNGDWSYKKSFVNGWVYEFEGVEAGKNMDYAIDAKTGALVKDRRDVF